ncbi:MAG TPA: hypothetical protein VNZ64_17770 [Candidatus Acidoferrum sp.]|nr:hypothetical protein [Candidatus Acidoferrum sp.]
MQWSGTVADVGNAVREGPLKLAVLLVYEDFETGLRAREAIDQTVQRLAADADLHVNLWKFELLHEPALYQQAVNEAVEADIVFIAARGHQELPDAVRLWVRQWLALKGGEPCALVRSLDANAANTPTAIKMLESLRTAGRRAGVDVFQHLGNVRTGWESAVRDLQHRAEMRTILLDEVLHQVERQPYRHWGINE